MVENIYSGSWRYFADGHRYLSSLLQQLLGFEASSFPHALTTNDLHATRDFPSARLVATDRRISQAPDTIL